MIYSWGIFSSSYPDSFFCICIFYEASIVIGFFKDFQKGFRVICSSSIYLLYPVIPFPFNLIVVYFHLFITPYSISLSLEYSIILPGTLLGISPQWLFKLYRTYWRLQSTHEFTEKVEACVRRPQFQARWGNRIDRKCRHSILLLTKRLFKIDICRERGSHFSPVVS